MPQHPVSEAWAIVTLRRVMIVAVLAALAFVAACGGLDSSLTDLEVGDCIADPGFITAVESLHHVDCSEPGSLRVVRVFDITGFDEYPGDATIDSLATSGCPLDAALMVFPTRDSWNGADDREVVCFE